MNKLNKSDTSTVVLLGTTAALGGMMFGFDLAIIVGAGPFLIQHFGLSDLGLGWAYSSLLFGCILGSVVAGRITDTYGRKRILLIVGLLFVITSVATGLAPTFMMFILARFASGIAVGGVSVLSPLYVAEVSPPKIRGRMGATYQLSITAGILISYSINYLLRDVGDWNWRYMFLTGALPSALFFLVLIKAPETPRFLYKVGRKQEGFELLERLMTPQEALRESSEIETSLSGADSFGRDTNKHIYRRILGISFILAILVHVSGIDTIIDYAPLILKSTGLQIDAALFSTFVIGGINFLFTLVSFWTIDRYGRRPLYIAGSIGMALALLLIVLVVATNRSDGRTLLLLMALFIAFFASCIGPVFWTLIPEIFPNSSRGQGMVIPVVTQWLSNAIVVLFFPFGFHRFGRVLTFSFLACMATLQALFAWRFLPETKGKTLEEIEEFWSPHGGVLAKHQ